MRIRNHVLVLLVCCGCSASSGGKPAFLECEPGVRTGSLPAELPEASGVAISRRTPGILWVHNDDHPAVLFAIDSTGAVKGRVHVADFATPDADWEDIAIAPCGTESCLYIADTGDNHHTRTDRAIYRVTEPLVTDTVTSKPVAYPFHLHGKSEDAEALWVMPDGRMFIVTKGRGGPVTIYRFPQPAQPDMNVELTPVTRLSNGLVQMPQMVTGAGVTPDGRYIAIRTYGAFQIFQMDADNFTHVLKHPYELDKLAEPQGEGVDIRDDGVLFFVSERGPSDLLPPVSRVQCHLPAGK